MKRIKVGFLPLYIKLYDDFSGPAYRMPMEAYMAQCVKALEEKGLELVIADRCRIASEFEAAADLFHAEKVDAVITMHLAYSPSLESIKALCRLNVPIVVLDSTPDYRLLAVQSEKALIGPNHGIHGVQDMCNLLKRNGVPYYICVGHALHSNVLDRVAGCCRAAAVKKAYSTIKVGSAGGCFTGMGDFSISDERYQKEIGARVQYLTPEIAETYLAQVTEEEIRAEQAEDAEKYHVQVENQENYDAATKAGLALRKWMAAEEIDAVTVNFLTVDQSGLPKMPFAELCKVLERGQGYAGEGDTLTAGLVGALAKVYPQVTFVEMFCPDWEQNVLLLSHYAESNPALAQWKPYMTDTALRYNSTGNTVGIYTCAKAGKACIVNLAPMNDSFTLVLCPGELLDAGKEGNAYTSSTQGWFQPELPLTEFLEKYSMAGGTHHSAMVYGVELEELKAFGKMMGFDVEVMA